MDHGAVMSTVVIRLAAGDKWSPPSPRNRLNGSSWLRECGQGVIKAPEVLVANE
jgi:hypothetical protein